MDLIYIIFPILKIILISLLGLFCLGTIVVYFTIKMRAEPLLETIDMMSEDGIDKNKVQEITDALKNQGLNNSGDYTCQIMDIITTGVSVLTTEMIMGHGQKRGRSLYKRQLQSPYLRML